jgi:beta-lactamase superfamily II metal-dependent hydrolase
MATKTLYKVQSGAYKNILNANIAAASVRSKIAKYLKKTKSKENISVAVISGGGWYRVQEGAFASKENAEKRKKLLRDAGVYAVVIETKTQDKDEPEKPVETKVENKQHRIRIVPLAFFDTGNESKQYGDCTLILEYGDDDKTIVHAVMIDCAMARSSANIIKKCRALGVTKLDAIVISHAHGDHYGGCTDIIKAFGCNDIYVPDPTQVSKYQKAYGNALRNQYKKAKGHYINRGTSWTIGNIHFECIYMCTSSALREHDTHHFVNNMSAVLRVTVNGWVYHTAGDLQNEGNNLLIKALGAGKLKADIFKCQWHGDANACNEAICRAIRPLIAFSNYHHEEGSGRGTTRKRLEKVGAIVVTNHKNGDIYFDCRPGKMVVTCSKKNFEKTFYKAA